VGWGLMLRERRRRGGGDERLESPDSEGGRHSWMRILNLELAASALSVVQFGQS
jgi:hypothetical protein